MRARLEIGQGPLPQAAFDSAEMVGVPAEGGTLLSLPVKKNSRYKNSPLGGGLADTADKFAVPLTRQSIPLKE
jgi:hypothetical protein